MDSQHARRESLLRDTSHRFCTALISSPAPKELLSTYFVPEKPRVTEHGPAWATARLPFLGREFTGTKACEEYFELLSETLKMELDAESFPSRDQFVVDPAAAAGGAVSVVGKGRFASVRTGKEWDERFTYRLSDFDAQGRIGHWEIWADPLSAWVAVGAE